MKSFEHFRPLQLNLFEKLDNKPVRRQAAFETPKLPIAVTESEPARAPLSPSIDPRARREFLAGQAAALREVLGAYEATHPGQLSLTEYERVARLSGELDELAERDASLDPETIRTADRALLEGRNSDGTPIQADQVRGFLAEQQGIAQAAEILASQERRREAE